MKKKILGLTLAGAFLAALLTGCGGSAASDTAPAPEPELTAAPTASVTETPAPPAETPEQNEPHSDTGASDSGSRVAGAEDMTAVEDVVEEGMTPIYAGSLREGVYPVDMKSSSSMFKADHVELRVEDGQMYAILYMTSSAYPYMYAGTAAQAAEAPEEELLPLEEAGEDMGAFTLPVEALDSGLSYAAYSRRKELWYDRTLLFRSDSLPAEAFAEGFFTTAESLGLADGEYTVEVSLSGGSGKASVTSPAVLTVESPICRATIQWSSKNYDYMRIEDMLFSPVNAEGENSTFIIPVLWFDRPMTVYADTTAMSQPHEIEYTLLFDSATLTAAEP